MEGVPFDALLKGVAALAAAALGLLVLSAGPRRGPWLPLGAFLLLIAGNQAAETIAVFDAGPPWAWLRIATVFAAFDPLALHLFASRYPEPDPLVSPWRTRLVAAGSVSFALLAPWMDPWTATMVAPPWGAGAPAGTLILAAALPLGLAAFTAVVYTAALVRATRALVREPGAPAWRLLHAAFCVAAFPVWVGVLARLVSVPVLLWTSRGWTFHPILQSLGLVLAVVVAAAAWAWSVRAARSGAPGAPGALRPGLILMSGVLLLVSLDQALHAAAVLVGAQESPATRLGRAAAAVRWTTFGVLVSVLLLRHESASMRPASRRRAARILTGLAVLSAGFVALVLASQAAGASAFTLRPIDWALLAGLVVGSQAFRAAVDRGVALAYGVQHGGPEGPLGPGERVGGRYLVVRLLGAGGGGRAFLARDELLGRDVAIKEILHEDAARQDAALREARLCARVRHPRVVTLYDVIRREGATLLVVEHVRGGTLADRLRASGPMAPREGLRMLDGILEGLTAVHEAGVVHRDVKPENVLVEAAGGPKIGDFGIARELRDATARLGGPGAFVGTLPYTAPEQRRGGPATPASDVYAVGVLARRAIRAPLPPRVEAVLARALQEDPAGRWRSAAEMRRALRLAEDEDAAADADEVAVPEGGAAAPGEGLEVEQGPVAARGDVLEQEAGLPAEDAAVLRAHEGVEVEGHVGVASPPDRPDCLDAPTRSVQLERPPLVDPLGEDEPRAGLARPGAGRRGGRGGDGLDRGP